MMKLLDTKHWLLLKVFHKT